VVLNTQPLELQTIPGGLALAEGQPIPAANRILLRQRMPTMLTEGFRIFHSGPNVSPDGAPNPNSIACVSCHPDGLTNGATTTINGTTRRVMPLAGHLKTATIVHWVGKDFHSEVAEGTFHTNMGGPELTPVQEASLLAFVRQLKAPAAPANADTALIEAGRSAFHKGQCDTCHVPETDYTDDLTADIGRGVHKVPSLIGLVYTAPYMSDGCAQTLDDRFNNPACGGTAHGDVQALTPNDVNALIAFLKTL
jgi:mono/diheme cytochrome c family protein